MPKSFKPCGPGAVQPKVAGRPLAPHVQAAIAAAAQPRMPAGAPPASPRAAHVQAGIAQARNVPHAAASRPPAAHVQAAVTAARPIALPASHPPAARPVPAPSVQAHPAVPPPPRPAPHVERAQAATPRKPAGPPPAPGVLQPAKRKAEAPLRRSSRNKKRKIDYSEETFLAPLDRGIEISEKLDIKAGEKERKRNLKKYRGQLKRKKAHATKRRSITYGKGRGKNEQTSLEESEPISKSLVLSSYGKAKLHELEPTFFYVSAPISKNETLEQHFVLREGHDYVLFPLVPDGDVYRQEGNVGPSFEQLAANAEEAASWLKKNTKKYDREGARARVARDVNRMAGGLEPRIKYPLEYLSGGSGLTSFAAVIRADKGRASKATKYIESILKESKTSFSVRFGGENPTYLGTGEGTGRGPQGLRKKGKEDPGDLSEYSSEED
jgi:hypothetical protein